jgi:cytochrome c553
MKWQSHFAKGERHMKHLLLGLALLTIGIAPVARGADAGAGKTLAQRTCIACHGLNGIGITDQYPDLAGQKAAYMVVQLKAFRDGSRNNPIMSPMAKPLSDADIDNVAAYYSSLGCH